MKRLLLPVLGLILFFSGFIYDVLFAGIPYQDPIQEIQNSYEFHQKIASTISTIGIVTFVLGLIYLFVLKLKKK